MEVSARFDDERGNAARIRAYGSGTDDEFVIDMKRVGRGECKSGLTPRRMK